MVTYQAKRHQEQQPRGTRNALSNRTRANHGSGSMKNRQRFHEDSPVLAKGASHACSHGCTVAVDTLAHTSEDPTSCCNMATCAPIARRTVALLDNRPRWRSKPVQHSITKRDQSTKIMQC